MELIADGLLIAAAAVAAIYCIVLSRRLRALKDLDKGLGGAIAGLSRQVDGMQAALTDAKRVSQASTGDLRAMTKRAETAAGRLELLLAAMHDVETPAPRARRASPSSGTPRPTAQMATRSAAMPGQGGHTGTAATARAANPQESPAADNAPMPRPELRVDTPELPRPHPDPEPAPQLHALPGSAPPPARATPASPPASTARPSLSDLLAEESLPTTASDSVSEPGVDQDGEDEDDIALRDMLAQRPNIRDALRDLLREGDT